MNKIYKVIWSKVRNCYVAVSEIAKRNGKSCTSVNCGAKANRRSVGVALALALSLLLADGGVAWAETIIDGNTTYPTIENTTSGDEVGYGFKPEGHITFTVSGTGIIKYIDGAISSNNNITIEAEGKVTGYFPTYTPYYSIKGGINNNTLTISGSVAKVVAGGVGSSTSNSVTGNKVTIDGGTVGDAVYGGYNDETSGVSVSNNEVIIQNGGNVSGSVYGGYTSSTGSAINNSVTISGTSIIGTSSKKTNVYGGRTDSGNATQNKVTINLSTGGEIYADVYGGYSSSGNAGGDGVNDGNTVTVMFSNGTVTGSVYGGYVNSGGGSAKNNKIIMNSYDPKVTGKVYGGYANGSGDATGNTVTISGGTINNDIFGGYTYNSGSALNNTIAISGGNFDSWGNEIVAGYAASATKASGNTVTLAGGNFTSNSDNLGFTIGGARGGNNSSTNIKDNTVNLYGTVTGLDKVKLYGGYLYYQGGSNWQGTGNELHIGGTKDASMQIEGITLAPWTDTTGNNKVYVVNNFNKIVLHKVNWSTTTPVLAANSFGFTNMNSYSATLDISDLNLLGTLSPGPMALLKSNNANFANMKLTYIDANNTLQSDKTIGSGISLKSISLSGTDTTTTGVSLGYTQAQTKVARSEDNKAINYIISPEFKTATLGAMNWDEGRTFVSGDVFDSGGLAVSFGSGFKVTGAENQENGATMNLLDLSATGGTIKSDASKEVTVTLADAAVTDKLTFSRSRKDTASASAGDNLVVYTTGAKDQVKTATFDGAIDWNTTTPYYTHATDSPYKFDSSTAINAADLTISFTDAQKAALKKDDSMTLLSASGITATNTVIPPTSNTVAISKSDIYSNTFTATAVGTVAAEADAVKYKISSIGVNTVTLGWGNMYGSSTRAKLPDTWTASNGTTIDASQFTLEYSTAWPVSLPIGTEIPVLTGTGLGNSTVLHQPGANKGKLPVNYTHYDADYDTGIRFLATATGTIAPAEDKLNYVVGAVEVSKVYLEGWKGTAASPTISVPTGWTAQDGGVDVDTNNMTKLPTNLAPGGFVDILTGSAGFFTDTKIQGANKYGNGDAFDEKPTGETGIAIAGNKVGGVKAENIGENVGAKLTYYAEKKSVSTITLGTETFTNGGTVYGGAESEFTNMYDATGATITTDDLAFSNSSVMEAGDSMTVLDASKAIKDGSGHALPAFTTQKTSFVVGFTDEVTDKGLTFKGTHTDTLSQDSAQTKILYTVGSKTVSGDDAAALTGAVTWSGGGTHYTNTKYTFDTTAKTNLNGLTFGTTNEDPYGKSMTLISGSVDGTVSNAPASFGVSLAKTNTTLDATAAGSAAIDSGDLKYTVNGVTIDKINVKKVDDETEAVPTGWALKKSGSTIETTVETGEGSTAMTPPSGLNPGDTRVIITASESLEGITINGDFKWKANGSSLPTAAVNGVAITGTQTAGGVKVNAANNKQLIYEESKKDVTGISFSETTFENGGTARTFDQNYDATGATINPDGLTFTEASRAKMETGNTMKIVDATKAFKNTSNETLAAFGGKTYAPIAFTDTITGKNLTFAGTHTDTLTQADDSATSTKQSLLIYTVGDKVVKTATLNGTVSWNDGTSYYTNGSDVNQNNVAATYKFDGNTSVDISNVSFSATADPLAGATKTMTLLKGVNGVAAGKVSGTPSFTVTLDQANTKLDAKATGAATVSGNDVTYTVSAVAIDKVNIKSADGTVDTVPANWTLATGASVETDAMTTPSGMNPGETRAIITATGTDYFNGITINGSRAWKVDGSTLTADLEVGGVTVAGTQTQGGVKVDETNKNQLIYEESKKKLTSITLGEATFANGGTARVFDNTYDATGANINANNLKFTEATRAKMETGNTMTIVDATAAFKDASGAALVAFADKTYTLAFSESNTEKNVTVAGTHTDTLSQDAAKTKLTYTVGTKDVKTVDIGKVDFVKGSTLFDRSGAGYNYAGVTALGTGGFAVAYASPETVTAGDSVTLLQANATLADMAAQAKETAYSYAPVAGVTIDAKVAGNIEAKGGAVTYTAAANQANKLTFGSVPWTDKGVLMTRPSNIVFAGADVDTSKISFNNISLLDANSKMTLVSDFGSTVGTITGTKYMIGTTNEGEGSASLEKGNLVFKTKTGAGGAAEQTHRTVMATEAGVAALATGQDFVDGAVEGLGLPTNISPDGTATYAATGGGKSRYKTGSHVDTRTWNAVVAVGSKREHKKGDLEWGVFAEYGRGSYTLHNDDGGKGDGDTHYAGGGLLVKWTNKHNVYTEASVRMGRISDSANNMLQDGVGNQYGYNVHANYYGGHLGVGKIYKLKGHRDLDVYGKFFYTRRNGVSFNAAGRYDLDAVSSSLLRVGARYGTNDKKWNWYGGLAFEYQFDGEAKGMLNGITPIRSASIKGASVRGEIGIRMDATKTNPWKADISIYGYGGRHRGFGGNISVAYMF